MGLRGDPDKPASAAPMNDLERLRQRSNWQVGAGSAKSVLRTGGYERDVPPRTPAAPVWR